MSYPEHEKLSAISDKSQTCGEFIDWLIEHDYHLCQPDTTGRYFWPTHTPLTKLLAEFFEIDLDKIEAEKRQMIEEMRKANA